MRQSEKNIHAALVKYIRLQYPKVFISTDRSGQFLAHAHDRIIDNGKVTWRKKKRANTGSNLTHPDGFPDLLLLDAEGNLLFLELKIADVRMIRHRTSDKGFAGEWHSDHYRNQSEWLIRLSQTCCASFAIGFDHAKSLVDLWHGKNYDNFFDQSIITELDVKKYQKKI